MRVFRLIFAWLVLSVVCRNLAADAAPVKIDADGVPKSASRQVASIIRGLDTPDAISDALQRAAFFDADVLVKNDTLIVVPGIEYSIGKVVVTIVRHDGSVSERNVGAWQGISATAEQIEILKRNILQEFQESGHYFASLQTESARFDGEHINFGFKIIAGPVVTVERVRFKGLRKSRHEFMANLTGISPGAVMSDELLREAVQKIRAQDYLHIDSTPHIAPNQTYDKVELIFFIEEGPRNIVELGGGYLPSQAGQNGQFVGKIDYRLRNPFGSGRKINFLYDKRDRNISIINFEFTQPIFIPQYLEIIGRVNQTDYDSLYHAFTAEAGVALNSGENTRISSRFSWTKTEPEYSGQEPTRIIRGTFGVAVSSFDGAFNPVSGASFAGDVSYIRRVAWPDSSSTGLVNNESSFSLAFESVLRVYRRLRFGVRGDANVLLTSRDFVPYSEQFKLGGFGSLRGYRQDQFAGQRTALIQQELIFRTSGRAAVYLFGDVGYVYARKKAADNAINVDEKTRIGSGAGIRIGSRTARLTLEVGWGKGDSAGDGKVHLGLQTAF